MKQRKTKNAYGRWLHGTPSWVKGTEISIMTGIGGDLVTYGENE